MDAALLRAFAAALEAQTALRDRLRLAVVGNGPLLEELRALAASLGIAANTWLPGALDNVPEVLKAFDLFVLPSLHEGYGMALAEAMAHGLPIVTTRAGAIPETVPREAGLLVPPGDAAGLAFALERVITDHALAARMGAAARERASKTFWA